MASGVRSLFGFRCNSDPARDWGRGNQLIREMDRLMLEPLALESRNFINGEWHVGLGGRRTVLNPSTGAPCPPGFDS